MAIDSKLFRQIMGGYPSGVTIVTTLADGQPGGMTANAVCSVSLNPPLVLFCADKRSRTHAMIDQSGVFAVNFLSAAQREASDLFARPGASEEERFATVATQTAETGSPILEGSAGWLDCRVLHRHAGGDHTIFVGEVVAGGHNESADPPLAYLRGAYGRFEPT